MTIVKDNLDKYSIFGAITDALIKDTQIVFEYGLVFSDILDSIQDIQEMKNDMHVLVTEYSFLFFICENDRSKYYDNMTSEHKKKAFFMRIDKDNEQYTLVY